MHRGFFLLIMEKTITSLSPQKYHSDRVNIYLDGEFAFGLPANLACDLRIGDRLTLQRIEELEAVAFLESAFQSALRLINYRPRTRKELSERLQRKGYPQQTILTIIERLTQMGLLNDEIFTRLWLESRSGSRPKSRRMLSYELQKKGISDEVLMPALSVIEEDEVLARRALDMRHRKWQQLDRQRFFNLAGAFLARRGFSYSTISKVLHEYWDAIQPAS